MSGGSFDYLFMKDFAEMMYNRHFLNEMLEELRYMGYNDIADEIDGIVKKFDKLGKEMDKFEGVFKAVEWKVSGDSGADDVEKAVKKLRKVNVRIRCPNCESVLYHKKNGKGFCPECGHEGAYE